ncbi:FAD-dependent oxidoreductase, partial [Burkholderia orbicola]|nr:FAD-dependent oxidoreductase [Burkholderia orbicola]
AVDGLAPAVRPVLVVPAGHAQPAAGVDVVEDVDGLAAQRYDAQPGTFYLLRPDQHVCARTRTLDRQAIADALARASCAR